MAKNMTMVQLPGQIKSPISEIFENIVKVQIYALVFRLNCHCNQGHCNKQEYLHP